MPDADRGVAIFLHESEAKEVDMDYNDIDNEDSDDFDLGAVMGDENIADLGPEDLEETEIDDDDYDDYDDFDAYVEDDDAFYDEDEDPDFVEDDEDYDRPPNEGGEGDL